MPQLTPVANRNLQNTDHYRQESIDNVNLRQEVKCLKISLSKHNNHHESVQQYRHELNRTVTELRQGQKHIEYLEETVARLEKRYLGLGLLCV